MHLFTLINLINCYVLFVTYQIEDEVISEDSSENGGSSSGHSACLEVALGGLV